MSDLRIIPICALILLLTSCKTVQHIHFSDGLKAKERGEYKLALKLLTPIANEPNYDFRASAQYAVGEIFLNGVGGKPDVKTAIFWLEKAANSKDQVWSDNANFALGKLYANGDKIRANPTKAKKFLERISINYQGLGFLYVELAELAKSQGIQDQFFLYKEKAIDFFLKDQNHEQAAIQVASLGYHLSRNRAPDKAIANFKRAADLYETANLYSNAIDQLMFVAFEERSRNNPRASVEIARRIQGLSEKYDLHGSELNALMVLEASHEQLGEYGKAFEVSLRILELLKSTNTLEGQDLVNLSIGASLIRWGKPTEALKYLQDGLKITQTLGDDLHTVSILLTIGHAFRHIGKTEEAKQHYQKAKKFSGLNKIDLTPGNAEFAILSLAVSQGKQLNKAYYKAKQRINFISSLKSKTTLDLANLAEANELLAKVSVKKHDYKNALMHLETAYNISESTGALPMMLDAVLGISRIYMSQKEYAKAKIQYTKTIELIDRIRETADIETRREFSEKWLRVYQELAWLNAETKDVNGVIEVQEVSRGQYVADLLNVETTEAVDILSISAALGEDMAVLGYSNTEVARFIVTVLTSEQVASGRNPWVTKVREAHKKYEHSILKSVGISEAGKQSNLLSKSRFTQRKASLQLRDLVSYYRHLLSSPKSLRNLRMDADSTAGKLGISQDLYEIGRLLYDIYVGPIKKLIERKKQLIIIPDGSLFYIPFEALIDKNNQFLVESFDIHYTYSLASSLALSQRVGRKNRKAVMAFGGAVYEVNKLVTERILSRGEVSTALQRNQLSYNDKQKSLRAVYSDLGQGSWSDLPGTLKEIEAIAELVPNTTVIKGADVSENTIRQLSQQGSLSEYIVLHFATHGVAMPNAPELSAIVLSQNNISDAAESDGYLNAREISELTIDADLVVLSACETGLGKLFGGEGIVGLTQSFFSAGAKATLVSLWPVADASTALLMKAIYKISITDASANFGNAIAKSKRDFIAGKYGKLYRHPLYWAPFVKFGAVN